MSNLANMIKEMSNKELIDAHDAIIKERRVRQREEMRKEAQIVNKGWCYELDSDKCEYEASEGNNRKGYFLFYRKDQYPDSVEYCATSTYDIILPPTFCEYVEDGFGAPMSQEEAEKELQNFGFEPAR